MGGLASRNKGRRGEYCVRDYFRRLGAASDRVPLSGAAPGFKGDVRVVFPGQEPFYVEVKKRAKGFEFIYEYLSTVPESLAGLASKEAQCVAFGTSFEAVKDLDYYGIPRDPKTQKVVDKLLRMRDNWLQGCSYLVLQQDRKPLVFVRFS